jgi:anti-sigma-K factor RskA
MIPQNHETIVDLIPAYAIGAADAEERAAVDAHLKSCTECGALVEEYQSLGEDLLYAAPLAPAPVRLTEDLRMRLISGPVKAPRQTWLGFIRRPSFAFAFGALALLVLLVLTNVYWFRRVGNLEHQTAEFMALAQAPGVTLRAASATDDPYSPGMADGIVYLQPGSNVALLCVYALPQLEQGKTYQAWLVEDGTRTSAGTFDVNAAGYGVLLINSAKPVSEYQQLGITVEPAGGSPAPTTPRVIGGEL